MGGSAADHPNRKQEWVGASATLRCRRSASPPRCSTATWPGPATAPSYGRSTLTGAAR
jgi:hypothetical protein